MCSNIPAPFIPCSYELSNVNANVIMTLDDKIDQCEKLMQTCSNKGELMRLKRQMFQLQAERIRIESKVSKYPSQSIK